MASLQLGVYIMRSRVVLLISDSKVPTLSVTHKYSFSVFIFMDPEPSPKVLQISASICPLKTLKKYPLNIG